MLPARRFLTEDKKTFYHFKMVQGVPMAKIDGIDEETYIPITPELLAKFPNKFGSTHTAQKWYDRNTITAKGTASAT